MSLLSKLILSLKENTKGTPFIKNKEKLIKVLNSINEIIGLDKFKTLIAKRFKKISVNFRRGVPNTGFNNMVISGPPGVGKTMCAVHLAEFYNCLDLEAKQEEKFVIETPELFNNELTKSEIKHFKLTNFFITIINMFSMYNNVDLKKYLEDEYKPLKMPAVVPKIKGQVSIMNNIANYYVDEPNVPPAPKGRMKIFANYCPSSESSPYSENEESVVVVTRADLVGKFQGHTEDKVKEFLIENKGKTVVIDEAYILCTGKNDDYGYLILTLINKFMDEHPNDIKWIFVGYKKQLNETIFRYQPGLKRRITDTIEIDDYQTQDLSQILLNKLISLKWNFIDLNKTKSLLNKFIEKNPKLFESFAGSCINIASKISEELTYQLYDNDDNAVENLSTVDNTVLQTVLNELAKTLNVERKEEEEVESYRSIYM